MVSRSLQGGSEGELGGPPRQRCTGGSPVGWGSPAPHTPFTVDKAAPGHKHKSRVSPFQIHNNLTGFCRRWFVCLTISVLQMRTTGHWKSQNTSLPPLFTSCPGAKRLDRSPKLLSAKTALTLCGSSLRLRISDLHLPGLHFALHILIWL